MDTTDHSDKSARSFATADNNNRRLRPDWWHVSLWLITVIIFSSLAVQSVIDWETARGRTAPVNRLAWNAVAVHTGPFYGAYYWDYGRNRPAVITETASLFTKDYYRRHLIIVGLTVPLVLVLVLPSSGLYRRPVSKGWRVLAGTAFVCGLGLWYLSAMISVALLS